MHRRRRPDALLILALIVGIGFVATALSQNLVKRSPPGAQSIATTPRLSAQAQP